MMSAFKALKQFFAVPDDDELVLAQARAFTWQVPLLYGILMVNSLILAATHADAPVHLSKYVPAFLTLACIARLVMWLRRRNEVLGHVQARKLLKSTLFLSAAMGIGFSAWALSLYPYGNAYQQSHIAFYMGITTIGCVFCLMHMRGAAVIVVISVLIPFTAFFASTGNMVLVAVAVNLVLVIGALISILLGNYRDFASLVASRGENDRLANIDSLTGLPNRRSFDRQLAATLQLAQKEDRAIAVARLDLDSFKSVNEIFGQITGDRVLVEVSDRIQALARQSTFVARLGADNFALILEGPVTEQSMRTCGNLLCSAMAETFDLPGAKIHLSASVGFAAIRAGDTPESLYDRADYAASLAKRDERGTAVVFTADHARDIIKVRNIQHALFTADLDQEIYILFQPQVDLLLNRVTGYEVLARWRSPTLGDVSPVEFIPMAERAGMISKITQTVLQKALDASVHLPRNVRLSVNLSAHDLTSATAIEAIAELVVKAGKPCKIDFEITETAVMRDFKQANASLLKLLALGSRIALDDFGTGHSSLTHVQKLPLDRIKIDRSFVAEVSCDPTSRAIVKTTVDLCRNLGCSCVFEGIETEEQLDTLVGLGGSLMQGYLFGRPVPLEEALRTADAIGRSRQTSQHDMLGATG